MTAIWYRARRDLRAHVGSTLLLILLVAVAGGAVMAAVAGAQRTRNALPQFLDFHGGYDGALFINPELPADERDALLAELIALPVWETNVFSAAALYTAELPDGTSSVFVASQSAGGDDFLAEIDRPIVVAGRLPDLNSTDEVAVNEAFADDLDLAPGDHFTLRTVSLENLEAAGNGEIVRDPNGVDVPLMLTGIVRQPQDLGRDEVPDSAAIQFRTDGWSVWTPSGAWEQLEADTASYGSGLIGRLREDATVDDLQAAAGAVGGENVYVERVSTEDQQVVSVRSAIDVEADALLLFAAVVVIAAAALVGQAISRQAATDLADTELLEAIGLSRGQRAAVPLLRAAVVALAGTALAGVVAVAASPLTPIGVARRAELHPGVDVAMPVILIGSVVLILAVLLRAAVASWRAAAPARGRADHARERRSLAAALLARTPLPCTTTTGIRMALDPGRGRAAVPVRRGLIALGAGVLALTAILVFLTSLNRVVGSPELQGWTWDVAVGNFSQEDKALEGAAILDGIDGIESYVGLTSQPSQVDGVDTPVAGIGPGELNGGPQATSGRLPAADDEIALAPGTLEQLDKEVGDTVTLTGESGGALELEIVGTADPPASLDDIFPLDEGAIATLSALQETDRALVANQYLVTVEDGAAGDQALQELGDAFNRSLASSRLPNDYKNLRRVQRLPVLLAAVIALLAVGTLANTLITSVRRRRRELATLATLGFRPRQLASTVGWQSITYVAVALALGIPLGLVLGRAVWAAIMDRIGSSVPATTAWPEMAALAVVTLAVTLLLATGPAWSAARARPADGLRDE